MSKPSPGAMKAASKIRQHICKYGLLEDMEVDESLDAAEKREDIVIAAIIDEETGVAELLEVVKAMDNYWSEDYDGPDDKNAKEQFHSRTIDIWNSMRAAIAKAEVKP